ncbi:MAG TPA: phosphate signaling complex protein PhoU [Candidatus Hydrogenedentes bacterium]|nr:phosphate signaling complex protein PhoU [Candidatus Hydrogenedentota bacterium]HRK33376.1 phosphate signaling complex protein PhoU [Candidatus Hydrogenedentota bacterium]
MSVHFLREIDRLKKQLLSLSAFVEEGVEKAVRSVRDRDSNLARQVIDNDGRIDELDVDIEEECQKILALHQPVAHDLRFIIAIIKINGTLEHIGDCAVNIAERALFLAEEEHVDIPFDFTGMAEKARNMLRLALDALVNQDEGLAYRVIAADDEVDQINRDMYGQVKDGIRNHPEHLEALIHLLSISRLVERIADMASHVAEEVIYYVKGDIVRHKTEQFLSQIHSGGV